MTKTHNVTGLKYLCVTTRNDHVSYTGSGVYWCNHLKKHGYDCTTEVLFESDDVNEFNVKCASVSAELDVQNNVGYANMIPEHGYVGNMFIIYEQQAAELGIETSEHISNTRKKYFARMSDEERYEYTAKYRKGLKKFLDDKDSDKYKAWTETLSAAQKKHWSEKSDAERKEFSESVSKGRLAMSEEKKKLRADRFSSSIRKSEKRAAFLERHRNNEFNKGMHSNLAKIVTWKNVRMTVTDFKRLCKEEKIPHAEVEKAFSERSDCFREYKEMQRDVGVCPHCMKQNEMSSSFKRWHFDNCRTRKI